ncbi:hypothetical protein P3T76_015667 [Phytophthora citrophthora]|uniref:Myb/SANT-like domain-containing protein n=1 Tax=Phytophthora citrophthora TaxID=4793 RepID=A0AAD9FYZ8_9STRA|nr:hypothetical protein P3T76_015667 [Phytophthora citrophthora]
MLFLESETMALLDLYADLHANPKNLTNGGVMLKPHAREQLTESLNRSFPREQPWTETQVTVKFKNLRSDYAELKWLCAQPGFRSDGECMTDDWWENARKLRPKCNPFKGKLPWPFEARMREILGENPRQRLTRKKEKQQLPRTREEGARQEQQAQEQVIDLADEESGANTTATNTLPVAEEAAAAAPPRHKRKRDESIESDDSYQSRSSQEGQDRRATGAVDGSYGRSLARSVEQSAMASAGMARGFQDLIAIFQEQTAKCRVLEQQQCDTETPSVALADQRSVLLSIARSLEQSTRAAADLAQGYRELVRAFVRESDATRQQRE